jgi:hypothetical protein
VGGTDACAQCRRAPCRARPALLGFQFPQQGWAGRPLSRATGPREDLAPRPQSLPGLADIPGVGSNIWMRMLIRPPRRRQFGALEAGPSEQALKARADLPTASVTPLNDTHIQAPGPLSFIKKKKKKMTLFREAAAAAGERGAGRGAPPSASSRRARRAARTSPRGRTAINARSVAAGVQRSGCSGLGPGGATTHREKASFRAAAGRG